jgi:chemotaxis protein MotB
VLRVDGHTDVRPTVSSAYRSNWELSAARHLGGAISDGKGVSPQRLVAAGFGEFQPIIGPPKPSVATATSS